MLGNTDKQRAWPILPLAPTGNIEVTSCLIPEKFALSPKCSTHVTSMLPLPRRGNVPQTLCHRPFPTTILPRYLILRKTLKNKNSCFLFCSFPTSLYLCKCYLPMRAGRRTEVCGAGGWSTTYQKGVTDALFLVILKLPLSESRSRTSQGQLHGVQNILSVVCCEG